MFLSAASNCVIIISALIQHHIICLLLLPKAHFIFLPHSCVFLIFFSVLVFVAVILWKCVNLNVVETKGLYVSVCTQ